MEGLLTILLIDAIVCGVLGGLIGSRREAGGTGFVLGFLFGPLGVIAAFTSDGREQCPHCKGRLNGKPRICQHCQSPLDWPEEPDDDGVNPNDFGTRCSRCNAILSNPVSAVGNPVTCPHCKKMATIAIFRREAPVPPPKKVILKPITENQRLMLCPDCDRQVSKRAKSCPNCGCDLQGISD